MNRESAQKNVVDMQRIFPKSFAVYGTALGSLRENDVIQHDLDTDIGIFIEDLSFSSLNNAVREGFDLIMTYGSPGFGYEMAFRRNGVKTDVMCFYRKDGKIFNCLWDNWEPIIHEYQPELFEVILGKLGENVIKTLGEPYVKHVYGDEWKTPITEWNWRTDHKCIKNE